ncbi:hypothetical protein BgiBS90_033314 [Biomphalaria glabrata]|nr:hypothetical protein BgiBS90_033314 [Biomphalaria glabrata]
MKSHSWIAAVMVCWTLLVSGQMYSRHRPSNRYNLASPLDYRDTGASRSLGALAPSLYAQTQRPPQSKSYSMSLMLQGIYQKSRPGHSTPPPPTETTPNLSIEEMESIWKRIEPHLGPKDANNSNDYTRSRMLLMLLTEECQRMISSGSPRTRSFCQQLNNRFP